MSEQQDVHIMKFVETQGEEQLWACQVCGREVFINWSNGHHRTRKQGTNLYAYHVASPSADLSISIGVHHNSENDLSSGEKELPADDPSLSAFAEWVEKNHGTN